MPRLAALVVLVLAAAIGTAVLAPSASASITPTVTLTQSGTAAGSANNSVTIELNFSPSTGDSAKDLTVRLPPGLLADASIDGGACLHSTSPVPACQVGTGTVTTASGPASVTFYLVAPLQPRDLAGLALTGLTQPVVGDVTLRSSGDPAGVGLNIAFSSIPQSIGVQSIDVTFTGMRLPTSCPTTPANVTVTADSWGVATPVSATAPISVTGCSTLPYAPQLTVIAAVLDQADNGVQVITEITQQADEATTSSVALLLPLSTLNLNGGAASLFCSDPTFATCTPVGSVTATSPLYPTSLTGTVYLTGSVGPPPAPPPAITLVFAAPFPVTVNGVVSLSAGTTTFANIPDIPLTDLKVILAGGPDNIFNANCAAPTGTATATLTPQNRTQPVTRSSTFTVSGLSPCPPPPPPPPPPLPPSPPPPSSGGGFGGGSSGGGSLGGSGGGSGTPSGAATGKPTVSGTISGLTAGHPKLQVKLLRGRDASDIRLVTIVLPSGLSFNRKALAAHKTCTATGTKKTCTSRVSAAGLSISAGALKSAQLRAGRLLITLKQPAAAVSATIQRPLLTEGGSLERRIKRHAIKSLRVIVIVTSSAGTRTTLVLTDTKPH